MVRRIPSLFSNGCLFAIIHDGEYIPAHDSALVIYLVYSGHRVPTRPQLRVRKFLDTLQMA